MTLSICTLFEKDYHFGAAALINSLISSGFTGTIFCGVRGDVVPWASGSAKLRETNGIDVVFKQLNTRDHFTNFKPAFMLSLLGSNSETDQLLYLDPDITVEAPASWLSEALETPVLVCEDINSPLPASDPRRFGWAKHIAGYKPARQRGLYANGGLVGARNESREFLRLWLDFTDQLTHFLGGGDVVGIGGGRRSSDYGHANCFDKTDQDVLNAAIDCFPEDYVSFLSRHAMGFQAGTAIFPHALGGSKPWRKNYLRALLEGFPPSVADKSFWHHVGAGPIFPFSSSVVRKQRKLVRLCALIGRFYSRR